MQGIIVKILIQVGLRYGKEIAIFLLVLSDEGAGIARIDSVGNVTSWIAAGLTLFTGYAYLKASFKYFLSTD